MMLCGLQFIFKWINASMIGPVPPGHPFHLPLAYFNMVFYIRMPAFASLDTHNKTDVFYTIENAFLFSMAYNTSVF